MRTSYEPSNLAVIATFAALAFALLCLVPSNCAAASATFCEGTIEGAGETSGIPNGHFFTIGISSENKVQPDVKDCVVESGTGTQVIDGTCTINGTLLNPCVITGNVTTVIALSSACKPVYQAEGTSQSTPGLAISYSTSGPLNGCAEALEVFPFNGSLSAYSVSLITTRQVPSSLVPGIGTCPAVGAGGIATCVATPQ